MARRLLLNSRMGTLKDDTPVVAALTPEQFAGPGVAHVGYGEYNQRHLLDRWADYLDTDDEVEVQVASIGTGITNNGEAPA